MKIIRNNKGLTLIEVIVSLAILTIIMVVFLSVFTSGFGGIIRAGKLSKVAYASQQAMENTIEGNTSPTSETSSVMSLTFDSININVNGKIKIIQHTDGDHTVELATFIPD